MAVESRVFLIWIDAWKLLMKDLSYIIIIRQKCNLFLIQILIKWLSAWHVKSYVVAISWTVIHYDDVIMDAMVSQITSLTIVYSTVYSGADQSKHQSSASLACGEFPGEFPAQMASNAENVSIWWRHHVETWYNESSTNVELLVKFCSEMGC